MNPENDHDKLIEIAADVKALRSDIQDLKDNVKGRIDDHESRLRSLEMTKWIMWGAITILAFFLTTLSNVWTMFKP